MGINTKGNGVQHSCGSVHIYIYTQIYLFSHSPPVRGVVFFPCHCIHLDVFSSGSASAYAMPFLTRGNSYILSSEHDGYQHPTTTTITTTTARIPDGMTSHQYPPHLTSPRDECQPIFPRSPFFFSGVDNSASTVCFIKGQDRTGRTA